MKLSEKAQAALQAVIDVFQSGDLSPIVEIAQIQRDPRDDVPSSHWTLSNLLMAFIQTGDLDARGYQQWRTAGRQVRKGERAAYILAPRIKTVENEQTGEKAQALIGFLGVPVFGFSQTEGDDLPTFDYRPRELPPLQEVAAHLGLSTEYVPLPQGTRGKFNPVQKKIALAVHDPKTWFHELGHACHAQIVGKLKPGQDAHQETVAEFTATVLMWLYGFGDRTGNAWQYIQQYHSDPLTAITKALGEVERILALIEEVQSKRPADAQPSAGQSLTPKEV